jgi:Mg2+ and Co2+ transporter CorA
VAFRLRGLQRPVIAEENVAEEQRTLSVVLLPNKLLTSSCDAQLECVRSLGRQTEASVRAREPSHTGPGALAASLVEALLGGTEGLVSSLQDCLDEQEEWVGAQTVVDYGWRISGAEEAAHKTMVELLGGQRRAAVRMRRWMAPQRSVLAAVALKVGAWTDDEGVRAQLARNAESCERLLDTLESIREQSAVLKDELLGLHDARTSRALYVQTMISATFLPFTFATGLLSMYITYPDYISRADDYASSIEGNAPPPPDAPPSPGVLPYRPPEGTLRAFYIITATLCALLAATYLLMRKLRWL